MHINRWAKAMHQRWRGLSLASMTSFLALLESTGRLSMWCLPVPPLVGGLEPSSQFCSIGGDFPGSADEVGLHPPASWW